MIATSYFAKRLERIGPDDAASTFATLPAHPVSILPLGEGWLVAAHGAPFTSGPEFTKTQTFLVLDAAGAVTDAIPAPEALFLNGMSALADGTILVADSITGTIWRLDPSARTITPWFRAEFLAQPPDMEGFQPGANGLKQAGGHLYVSNSARGAIGRIGIGADGAPIGQLEPVVETGGVDDFWIDPDGAIVFATHGDTLGKLAPEGARSELLAAGCDACTAVAPRTGPDGPERIVLTTGGLLEANGAPARILALPRTDGGAP